MDKEKLTNLYKQKLEDAKKLQTITEWILKGVPVTSACYQNGIDYITYRRFLNINFSAKRTGKRNTCRDADIVSWQEKLLQAIFGKPQCVLPDFDEAYKKALSTLSERERMAIKWFFEDECNLVEIGNEFGVTREMARQIKERALRKLRYPVRARYFLHGANVDETMEYEHKIRQYTMEREQLLQTLKNQANALGKEVKELKEEIPKSLMRINICDIGFSARATHFLYRRGINNLYDLSQTDVASLASIKNIGAKTLENILQVLYETYGIKLKGGNYKR